MGVCVFFDGGISEAAPSLVNLKAQEEDSKRRKIERVSMCALEMLVG